MRSGTVENVTSDLSRESRFNHKSVKSCKGKGPFCVARFNHFSLTGAVL